MNKTAMRLRTLLMISLFIFNCCCMVDAVNFFDLLTFDYMEGCSSFSLDSKNYNYMSFYYSSGDREPGLLGPGSKLDIECRLYRDIGDYMVYVPVKGRSGDYFRPHIQLQPFKPLRESDVAFNDDLQNLASAAMLILNSTDRPDLQKKLKSLFAPLNSYKIEDIAEILKNNGPLRLKVLEATYQAGLFQFNDNGPDEWRGCGYRVKTCILEDGVRGYSFSSNCSRYYFSQNGYLVSYRPAPGYPEVKLQRDKNNKLVAIVSNDEINNVSVSEDGLIDKITRDNKTLFSGGYDVNNRLTIFNSGEHGERILGYDKNGRLATVNFHGREANLYYYPNGRMKSLSLGWFDLLYLEYKDLPDGTEIKAFKEPGSYYYRDYETYTVKNKTSRGFKFPLSMQKVVSTGKAETCFDDNWGLLKIQLPYGDIGITSVILRNADGFVISWQIEDFDENFVISSPTAYNTTTYGYCTDTANLINYTSEKKQTASFEYDDQERLVQYTNYDGETVKLVYKNNQSIMPEKIIDSDGTIATIELSDNGMIRRLVFNGQVTVDFSYVKDDSIKTRFEFTGLPDTDDKSRYLSKIKSYGDFTTQANFQIFYFGGYTGRVEDSLF